LAHPDRGRALVLLEGDAIGLSAAGLEWTQRLDARLREVAAQDGVAVDCGLDLPNGSLHAARLTLVRRAAYDSPSMEATSPPAKRIAVGEVINEVFSLYGRNVLALIGSAIAVFVVVGVATGLLETAGGIVLGVIAAIIQLAGHALYTGFVVRLVQDVRDGRRDHTVGDLFSATAPSIGALIVFGIFFGIGVGIGLVLLIIPGLILLTMWSVGAPAIVVERAGAFQAFGRSWRLVRGEAWSVFWTLVVVLLIVIAVGVVLGAIATPISDGATVVAAVISNVLTAPVFALAVSVMFFDLGGGEQGQPQPAASTTSPPPPPA
jgi:hypothetical protein